MHIEAIEELLQKSQAFFAQGETRQASMLLDKVLRLDFTNQRAWQMLHQMLGKDQPFEVFQRSFAERNYPARAHLLNLAKLPAEDAPSPPASASAEKPAPPGEDGGLCPSCGRYNPPGSAACLVCGVNLEKPPQRIPCPACRASNPVEARFCNRCGARLQPDEQPAPQPPPPPVVIDPPPPVSPPQRTGGDKQEPVVLRAHEPAARAEPIVLIPDSPAPPAQPSNPPAQAGASCPNCRRLNPRDARLCAYCGYDFYYQRVVSAPEKEKRGFRLHFIDLGSFVVAVSLLLPWSEFKWLWRISDIFYNIWGAIAHNSGGVGVAALLYVLLTFGAVILARLHQRVLGILASAGGLVAVLVVLGKLNYPGPVVGLFGAILMLLGVIFYENEPAGKFIKRHWLLLTGGLIGLLLLTAAVIILPETIRSAQADAMRRTTQTQVARTMIPRTQTSVGRTESAYALTPQAGAQLNHYRMVYIQHENNSYFINLSNGDASNSKQLLSVKSANNLRILSDGKTISFQGFFAEDKGSWVVNTDGKNLRRLTTSDQASWSPDDRYLAYMENNAVWVVNSDGSNPRKVTDGRFITWTPDSRGLVFKGESDKPPVTVSRVNLDGSGLNKIASLNLYGNGMMFNWIPDGKSIIVSAACDPAKMDANSIQYQRCLFLLDVASGNLKKYTNPANSTVQVDSVRPDGQMVLYTDRCNTKTVSRCLYTLHVSSGKITPLTTVDIGGVNQTRISISPDWKKVGFEASLNNKTDIFSVDLASAKLTRITNGGSSFYPTWSADGVWLLYQNGSKLYAVQPGNPPLWIRTNFQITQAVFLP